MTSRQTIRLQGSATSHRHPTLPHPTLGLPLAAGRAWTISASVTSSGSPLTYTLVLTFRSNQAASFSAACATHALLRSWPAGDTGLPHPADQVRTAAASSAACVHVLALFALDAHMLPADCWMIIYSGCRSRLCFSARCTKRTAGAIRPRHPEPNYMRTIEGAAYLARALLLLADLLHHRLCAGLLLPAAAAAAHRVLSLLIAVRRSLRLRRRHSPVCGGGRRRSRRLSAAAPPRLAGVWGVRLSQRRTRPPRRQVPPLFVLVLV